MTAEAVRGAEWYKYDANYAADQPRRNYASCTLQFLKDVPVTWGDVRFLDGSPGSWIVLARKKGDA